MGTKRIRKINVLEIEGAVYDSTFEVGMEMSNWLNASMHVCMIETKEQKEFYKECYGSEEHKTHLISRLHIEEIMQNVQNRSQLLNNGYSIDHFDEKVEVKEFFKELTLDECFSVLGYNKSSKHKEVLKKLLQTDLENPLMLVPMGKIVKNYHRIVVPFEPLFVTKKKLKQLKWYADQLGVMVDFVHFKKKGERKEMMRLNHVYETIFSWVDELNFSGKVKFRFPISDKLNEGLKEYLRGQQNYLLCVIDDHIKSYISTSSTNEECLMDIKEPVVII